MAGGIDLTLAHFLFEWESSRSEVERADRLKFVEIALQCFRLKRVYLPKGFMNKPMYGLLVMNKTYILLVPPP